MVNYTTDGHTGLMDCDREASGNPATQSASPLPPAKAKKLILLVEDHIDSAIMFKQLLEFSGYAVMWAETVEAANEIFDQHPVDLLISDINLPDGTGHEVMRHIAGLRRIPGVAISALSTPDDIERSLDAGFSVHLAKPISPYDLRQLIEKFLPPE